MDDANRGSWKSRTGFLLAVIGSAVGLGNIWRFPFVAYKSGGGAFMIPYAIALLTVGIPLMILELGIGHKFRASAPMAFSRMRRRWELLGWWIVTYIFFGIIFYYCVVIAWCVNYLKFSFGLEWGANTQEFFFKKFLNLSSNPYVLGGIEWPIVAALVIVWFINWLVLFKGVRKGIETVSRILLPCLFVMMIILVVWSFTLGGAEAGVRAYLTPDFSRLKDISVWSSAFSQVFFSISVALGIMIAYGSYLPAKADIKSSAIICSLGDTFFAIFAGLAVFATLGYMSQTTGVPIYKVATEGPGLAFVTYPESINNIPFGRSVFGIIFFLILIFAGITSSISIAEAAISSVIDKFGWSRKKVVTVFSVIGLFGGTIFVTGAGLYWLDLVDHFIMHLALIAAGLLEAVVVGWVMRPARLRAHINESSLSLALGSGRPLGRWWEFAIAVWIPLVLGVLLIIGIVEEVRRPYSSYNWNFIIPFGFGWIATTVAIGYFVSGRRRRLPPAKEAGF